MGIDREKLKELLENELQGENEASSFRERLRYNQANSIAIELDSFMRSIIINILKGKTTAKAVEAQYGIDSETIRYKINEFMQSNKNFLREYIAYLNKKGHDYEYINFTGLIAEMIKSDMSQSEMAREFGIPSRVISREIEKLGKSDEPEEVKLYDIAKIYADKKMRRIPLSRFERALYTRLVDEMFGDVPIINERSRTDIEIERLEAFMRQVQEYRDQGLTVEQVAEELETSVSTIRRNRLKLEELKNKKRIQAELESSEEKEPE